MAAPAAGPGPRKRDAKGDGPRRPTRRETQSDGRAPSAPLLSVGLSVATERRGAPHANRTGGCSRINQGSPNDHAMITQ
eukprot:5759986-Prymnesium_polylepis.1